MASATATALSELHARLADDGSREAYWAALSRFLRFDLSKADFDQQALAALGPHVALHNRVILALLRDAQQAPPESGPDAMQTDEPNLHIFGLPPVHSNGNAMAAGAGSAAASACDAGGGRPMASSAAPAGPKLMLKISQGPGGMAASSQRPELVVDPREEMQLNALHERLIELARQNGLQVRARESRPRAKLVRAARARDGRATPACATDRRALRVRAQGVQPEAVSFMHRAVRAVSNRLLVAAASAHTDSGSFADAEPRALTADDVHDAIRQPVPAQWMAPPCQRAAYNLGAFSKFA